MKKIFNFAAVAALALAMASCSKDANEIPGGEIAGQSNTFTFVLPAERSVITYAGEVPASDNEKKLNLANTSVYMFAKSTDGSGKLEAVLSGSALTTGTNSDGKKTVTIEVDDAWSGSKTFYIVGNTDKGATASLATAVVNTTTEAQFEKLTTTSQGTTLISSTDGLLMAGLVDVTNVEQAGSSDITLYRSVARFDIKNDVTLNKVTIKRIDITDANLQGYITAYSLDVPAGAPMAQGDFQNIAVATTTAKGDAAKGEDATHDYQKQEGLFYLYPTQLKVDASGTIITLIGSVNGGADQIYTLNKEASNLPVDCFIKANTRYLISAIDVITRTFVITIAEWDEGDELIGRPNGGDFGIAGTPAITNGTFNAAYNSIGVTDPTAAFSASLKVKGTSSTNGVNAEVITTTNTGLIEVDGTVITATAVYDNAGVTYAVPYFGYDVTITFDAGKIEAGKNFTTIVRLTDKASGATADVIVFYENGTDIAEDGVTPLYPTSAGSLPAVKVGNLWWAPVNVGATTVNRTTAFSDVGYLFQWGRNIPFKPVAQANNLIQPLSFEMGNNTANGFICDGERLWTTEEGTVNDTWYKLTNSTYINTDPCPEGYRLPTINDIKDIVAPSMEIGANFTTTPTMVTYQAAYSNVSKHYYIGNGSDMIYRYFPDTKEAYRYTTADAFVEIAYLVVTEAFDASSSLLSDFNDLSWGGASTLIFPLSGAIVRQQGALFRDEAHYWLEDVHTVNEARVIRMNKNVNIYRGGNSRSNACSVRCVKDVTP